MKRKAPALFLFLLLPAAAGSASEVPSAYRYDVDAYRHVDPKRILYRETEPVPLAMDAPACLAVNRRDQIYVGGDTGVVLLDAGGNAEIVVSLQEPPRCLAVDGDGRLLVGTDRAVRRKEKDAFRVVWTSPYRRSRFTSLAPGAGRIFVADAGLRRVHVLTGDGRPAGTLPRGDEKAQPPNLVVPSPYFDVAFGRDGGLRLVDPGRHTVRGYAPDGELYFAWGKTGLQLDGFGGCCNPTHIALLPDGSVVTSEKGLPRVKLYDPAGVLLGVVAPPAAFDPGVTGLDLAVGGAGRVLVLDPRRKQVRIFVQKKEATTSRMPKETP